MNYERKVTRTTIEEENSAGPALFPSRAKEEKKSGRHNLKKKGGLPHTGGTTISHVTRQSASIL
jgi:hypothetical protein